ETERNWFFANVCTHDLNIEQDRGRTWAEAEALLIEQHPAREEHIRAFRKYWHEMVPHAYDGSVAIMEGLIAEGRDVTMLTNCASRKVSEAKLVSI
ncbi:HAD family phosphatase, partial [Rhizobium ruizarguesonis]